MLDRRRGLHSRQNMPACSQPLRLQSFLVLLLFQATLGQGTTGSTPLLLEDGSLDGSALYFPTSLQLKPDNRTYSKQGCYDSAPALNVAFGSLDIPQKSVRADETPGPRSGYGVHVWTTQFRHSNASTELYLLNDNLYWDLQDGTITFVAPVLLVNESANASAPSQVIADYDAYTSDLSSGPVTFEGQAFLTSDLNSAKAAEAGPAGEPVTQYGAGITTFYPEGLQPDTDMPSVYLAYLQRIAYYIETVALSRNSQCTFDLQGHPELAGIGNYSIQSVVAASSLNGTKGDQHGFVDGQYEALQFIVNNASSDSPNVCLASSDTSDGHNNSFIQGTIMSNAPAEDAGECCAACLEQGADAYKNGEEQCNFWYYCPYTNSCLFPDSESGTLPYGSCALGFADQLAVNETWGPPVGLVADGTQLLIPFGRPITGITLPLRANNATAPYGADLPVGADPSIEYPGSNVTAYGVVVY